MQKKVHNPIPVFTTRATAIVSVALVLIIVGLGAFVGLGARRLATSVKESMGFVVILSDSVTQNDIAAVTYPLKRKAALRDTRFSTADEVLSRWQQMLGEEDIVRIAGINPFHAELEVFLTPKFANSDSIERLAGVVSLLPMVENVEVHSRMLSKLSHTLRTVRLILFIIGLALTVVSFVLISNTVRLTVYAKRFLINTMQLVGATPSFVRRPFLVSNLIDGLVAGIIASVILCIGYAYICGVEPVLACNIGWDVTMAVCGVLIASGMVICFTAAYFAANRYLRRSYDKLFY